MRMTIASCARMLVCMSKRSELWALAWAGMFSRPRIQHNGSEPSSVLLYGLTYGGKMVAVAYPLN